MPFDVLYPLSGGEYFYKNGETFSENGGCGVVVYPRVDSRMRLNRLKFNEALSGSILKWIVQTSVKETFLLKASFKKQKT